MSREELKTKKQCDIVSDLLPCPFCGGYVVEKKVQWNISQALCTNCNEVWGTCGSKYEGRFDKWNIREKQLAANEDKVSLLCECGGNERMALDCTMKPCKHPKYFKG